MMAERKAQFRPAAAAILNDDVGFVHRLERRRRQHRQHWFNQPSPPKKHDDPHLETTIEEGATM